MKNDSLRVSKYDFYDYHIQVRCNFYFPKITFYQEYDGVISDHIYSYMVTKRNLIGIPLYSLDKNLVNYNMEHLSNDKETKEKKRVAFLVSQFSIRGSEVAI
jgi:hypothetical protein